MRPILLRGFTLIFAVLFYQNSNAQCPISNACTPGNATNAQAGVFGGGIFEVSLGTFLHTSLGAAEGYVDNCNLGTTNITLGSQMAISIKTGSLVSENLRVYIDLNNDLSFNPTTELVFSSNNTKIHTGNLNILNGIQNQPLKMRVTSDLITSAVVPGPCTTPEYSQVEDYAVQLVANTIPPIAAFSASDTLTCSGIVTFTDNSNNNPTSWLWNFGDNQTSTSPNPTHTYSTNGKYTVKLKVSSANGSDSITKVNLIHYSDTIPPVASCTPITQNQCCGYGITRVKFNTINNPSVVGSYENFTCSQRTTIYQGRSYNLNVTTNPNQKQDTKAWIDYNNNGVFEDSELVFSSFNTINASGSVLISTDTTVSLNVPLRLRVVSEYAGGTFNSCLPLDKGQCEDYTVVVLMNNLPPVAGFVVSSASYCLPTFSFQSTSYNVISSFHWFFGDGTDSVTASPSISHTYSDVGSYTVKLVVTGPYGVDSIQKVKGASYFGSPLDACVLTTQIIPQPIQVGIARVQFGTIDKSSGIYTDGYQDFACSNQTTALAGQTVQLKVKNSSDIPEKVRVWIDYNNSGTFDASELIFTSNNDTVHVGQIVIPSNAVLNQPLRVRIGSNANQAGNFGACGTIQAGQAEDYSIVVFPNSLPPVTLFTVDKEQNCTGIATFKNLSENGATSNLWSFGDGTTSTEESPVHSYLSTGTFTVKLVVSNSFGKDSLTKSNYITITQITGMVAATCTPAPVASCCQYGIQKVSFAGIEKESGLAAEGNMDFTCDALGSATIGTLVPISIINSGTNQERVGVWIDWDNNGVFATTELVYTSTGTTTHTGNITIPGNAPVGVGLRVRVRSDAANQPLGTACAPLQFGQTEDYQIKLIGNNNPPQALFSANFTTSCFNTIQFADTSYNAPTSWKWYFGDGDSSTFKNPTHTYPGPGSYTVTLIVSNVAGMDSMEKIGYITILNGQNLKPAPCSPATVNTSPTNPGLGIIQVSLGSINKSSGLAAAESYQDNSCSDRTTLIFGQNYTLKVRTNDNLNENCRAWIDWNNDGIFSDPAERVLNSLNARNHLATLVIPTGAKKDTALRLRIISDIAQGPGGNLQPCNAPNFGQVEDYSIVVIENTQAPSAQLFALNQSSCSGYVQFGDSSQFVPSSWMWTFGDGQTSTQQNPQHQYQSIGTYDVKLKVSNTFGMDSITRVNYITVTGLYGPKPAACKASGQVSGPFGINRVRLAELDRTSGLAATDGGFRDNSCSDSALVIVTMPGQTNPIIVNTSNAQNCRVYIDFNNDGQFAGSEMVLNTTNNNTHAANLIFLESQCLSQSVRMRVISDNRINMITGPCYNPLQGEVEDYMVRLIWAVGVQSIVENSHIQVFPNPSNGNFNIQLPQEGRFTSWTILDVQGKEMASGTISEAGPQAIKGTQLSSGLYYLSLKSEVGSFMKKIIVQK